MGRRDRWSVCEVSQEEARGGDRKGFGTATAMTERTQERAEGVGKAKHEPTRGKLLSREASVRTGAQEKCWETSARRDGRRGGKRGKNQLSKKENGRNW